MTELVDLYSTHLLQGSDGRELGKKGVLQEGEKHLVTISRGLDKKLTEKWLEHALSNCAEGIMEWEMVEHKE